MAKTSRAPLAEVLAVNESLVSDFDKFTQARADELARVGGTYINFKEPNAIKKMYGKVLNRASLIPAAGNRFVPGRGGKSPAFVVLCRVGDSNTPPYRSNLMAAVAEYTNSGSSNVATPHFLIGGKGEIVQLVDLDDTASFLMTSMAPPKAPSGASVEASIIDSVIQFAAHNEGAHGYASFNGSDNGAGVSFGYLQFNQKHGLLGLLMQEMNNQDPKLFEAVFGKELAAKLLKPDWVKNLSNNLAVYEPLFVSSASYSQFQLAQRNIAKSQIWKPTVEFARRMGLTSYRAYAVIFDAMVQRGSGFMNSVAASKVEASQVTTPQDKLAVIALAADTLDNNGKPFPGTNYNRRQPMLYSQSLSDADLFMAMPALASSEQLADNTAIIIMLEGRSSDPVTVQQRDATAAVLRDIVDTTAVQLSTAQVFGLDMLPGVLPENVFNPGTSFNYYDFIRQTAKLPKTSVAAVYKPASYPTHDDVVAAATNLRKSLQASRTQDGVKTLAYMASLDAVNAEVRAQYVATSNRASDYRAGSSENTGVTGRTAQAGADMGRAVAASQPPPPMDTEKLKAVIYNFKTGYWSDNKTGGKMG